MIGRYATNRRLLFAIWVGTLLIGELSHREEFCLLRLHGLVEISISYRLLCFVTIANYHWRRVWELGIRS
jgi:hypothetical protein